MSKNLEAKKVVVSEISEKLKNCQSMVVVHFNGITVEEVTELRNQFRAAGVEYCVLKNTLVRRALDDTELPARVFHPTHINRRKGLFEEALALAQRGCTVDITAFPVDEGEDAWSAAEAWERYHAAGAPAERLTISSDAGGCLPTFDHDGRMCRMDVGSAHALLDTVRQLLARGHVLDAVLPAFTRNIARHLRLAGKGEIVVGADADLVALDAAGHVADVMAQGVWHVRDGETLRVGMFENAQADRA